MKSLLKAFLTLTIVITLLPLSSPPTPTTATPLSEEIPTDWWTQVQADIRASEYEISWQTQTYLPDVPAAYHAANRTQNFRVYFTGDGIRVIPRTGVAGWDLGLSASGTGVAKPIPQANYITYHRAGLDEIFTNTEKGLRHELILDGANTLDLTLSGDLTPHITADGTAVEFYTAAGTPVLRYGDFSTPVSLSLPDATHLSLTFHASRFTPHVSRFTFHATLTALPATADWSAESNQADAQMGLSVAGAGDVNGDGFSDVIVGAPTYDGGQSNEGHVFVYHGSADGLDLAATWNREIDLAGAQFGAAVDSAGDVNGDGFSDVIIGAPNYTDGEAEEGAAFVYHGSAGGLGSTFNWSSESGQIGAHFGEAVANAGYVASNLYTGVLVGAPDYDSGQTNEGTVFAFYGSAGGLSVAADWSAESDLATARFGASVSTAGDVNGNGYADVIIGAPGYDAASTDIGAAFIYNGSAGGLSAAHSWNVEGDQENAGLGTSVSLAGDVDGNGYGDVIVGAPGYSNGNTGEGAAFIYLGSSGPLTTTAEWNVEGNADNAQFGAAVGLAGDVDGDGYADVIVGAPGFSDGETGEGTAFIFTSPDGDLSTTSTWTPQLNQAAAAFGSAVSTAGDVNGDGFSDVIVGAPGYSHSETNEGGTFVYYGHADIPDQTHNWIAQGTSSEWFGMAANSAGDVNGDGYADVIVGAPAYDNGNIREGRALLYLGSDDGLADTPVWQHETNKTDSQFGWAVSGAGDTNGDGYDDVVIGAPLETNGQTREGRAYIFFGTSTGLEANSDWYADANLASAALGSAVARAGDVNGDGYSDIIVGAPGYASGETGEGAAFIWLGNVRIGPGQAAGTPANAYWSSQSNQAGAAFGESVAGAGDVNGDGYSDVIVGASNYTNGENDEGAAFLFPGNRSAMSTSAAWHDEGDQVEAYYGTSVNTAGDVNGDGYSDIIVGARMYDNGQIDEGQAFLYYGTPGTISTEAGQTFQCDQIGAFFGTSVSTAGDVNGDGYADVLIGAPQYNFSGAGYYGGAFIYYGSETGPDATADWTETPSSIGSNFGVVVNVAGDVNGDGFSDVIIGTEYGNVYTYYGNGGGKALRPRQLQLGGAYLSPLRRVGSPDSVRVDLNGSSPLGHEQLKLEWQAAPLGHPFGDVRTVSGSTATWSWTGTTFTQTISGLASSTAYHWRVRLLYRTGNPLGTTGSRWIHMPWNGWLESDFQTGAGAITGLVATDDSPTIVGDTTTFTATANATYVNYTWGFGDGEADSGRVVTHTYASAGIYTAVVTASNGVSTVVASTDVTITDIPVTGLELVNDSPTVAGQTTNFAASITAGTNVTYAWDFGDGTSTATGDVATASHTYTETGTYVATVTAHNTAGSVNATSPVTITDAPIAGLALENDSPTPLDNATTLTASVNSGSGITYDWNLGDGTLLPDGGAVVQHVYPDMGTYMVIVSATNSVNSLTVGDIVTITAGEPVSGLLATNDSPTPYGSPTTLSAEVDSGSGVTYTWAFGDGSFFYPQNWPDSGKTVTHTYPSVGVFTATVTATNRAGELSATTVVTIEEVPIDTVLAGNSGPTMLGAATTLTATVTAGSNVSYTWDLGDGENAGGSTIMHTYPSVGVFTATVTATNPINSATTTTTVTIIPARNVYLPLVLRSTP